MMPRVLALDVAIRFLGKPYLWGGDNPIVGFDCSGFIVEILKSVGRLPRKGDWTAEQLCRQVFSTKPVYHDISELRPGMLVFWETPAKVIRHVEMVYAVTDGPITIGASGGGSATTSVAEAVAQDAYIKLRPVAPFWSVAIDPF